MSVPTVTLNSLKDYSALPVLRESIAAKAPGLVIQGLELPTEMITLLLQVFRVTKRALTEPDSRADPRLLALLRLLHSLATTLFNNLSHVLELPWEKYLSEMHEFVAPGADELALYHNTKGLSSTWSTVTFAIDIVRPSVCHVTYGKALGVFSENSVTPSQTLPQLESAGRILVYHVRPNYTTFYTRAAGALMTPLSDQEYEDRKTVQQLDLA
ncbi:hypothetical protein BU24DRAFT_457167 [Aaosphaeria arxii CBS 175.79]|uniref:Uncharacterized protein n=1 Tax=Aaosphaeria arxii CBS 175.79 TaxID=1450172 RepID=A0A6A5Y7G3_9PLEO|nr:uncharacterized protein BU24DRAFT_457167 [Aaosphaeria arxii CBS 175.79]KAF2021163.1 hypothetical protein BU24DRAFT_457167 [Aaosphaeria arxii CBS 175.79]